MEPKTTAPPSLRSLSTGRRGVDFSVESGWLIILSMILTISACSGPERGDELRASEINPALNEPVRTKFDAAVDDAIEPVFGARIRATALDFTMLGPSDVVPLDDERVYVLLSSARGTRTGRPMAIVDVDTGEISPTSAAPVPLTRPYGVATMDDGMVVWNLVASKHQPDLFYLETLHYDRRADLWRVLPPPESHLVQLADVVTDRQGRTHLDLVDANDNRSRYLLDVDEGAWILAEAQVTQECTTSLARDDSGTEWHTGARFRDTIEPCAFMVVDGAKRDLPEPPSARCLHVVVRSESAIWSVGGYESCGESKRPTSLVVDRLIDGEDSWERLAPLPDAVYPSGTTTRDDELFVFDEEMRIFNYDERAKGWAIAEPLPNLENNSDWTVISNDRVVVLAWEKGSNRNVNKLVILEFR